VFTQPLGTTTTGFEGQWRFLCDTQGLGTAAGRHPSADLLPIFNANYRSLRQFVTGLGYRQFCQRGATTALPTSAVEANETYATITLAAGVSQIVQVDAFYQGEWLEGGLQEIQLGQLRDYPTRTRGCPRAWLWLDAGSVSGSTLTAGKIGVTPVPNSGSYALWTMSEFTDLVQTTDVYLYHTEDWRRYHMYSAMADICGARDKDTARKLDFILRQLDPSIEGTPAYNIAVHAPTAAGPKTWTRSVNYRGVGPWR
jgi:hypothetical protein